MTAPEAELVLGPLLRRVDATSATFWVETDRPCAVRVTAGATGAGERTWSVHGHHYALVVLTGLEPATTTPYTVELDGHVVWPPARSRYPASVVRTERRDGALRLAFGSCRRSAPLDLEGLAAFGPDALVQLAERMAVEPQETWPDLLLMLGDQLYADEPPTDVQARLAQAHEPEDGSDVRTEIRDFEEYTWLYRAAWTPDPVRWLLSTVPTCMVLDDHDLRDDWNTSAAWREQMSRQPWWHDRVVGALGSYWVYQHLGNLSPAEVAADAVLAAVRQAQGRRGGEGSGGAGDAATRVLDAFAQRADAEPSSARWSFARDLGDDRHRVRLVAVDCRCSRSLEPGSRAILDDAEWTWVREAVTAVPERGRVEHLLLASTLPVLMLHGFADVESWNEAVAEGAAEGRGERRARAGELLRRTVDLEHWPAFRTSFDALVGLLARVCAGPAPPSSVLLLSGDVHCSYAARASLSGVEHDGTAVHQLVMSPFRNPLKPVLRWANRLVELGPVRRACRALARSAGVAPPAVDWTVDAGPWFFNGVMTVVLDGADARVEVAHVRLGRGGQVEQRVLTRPLTP